MLVSQRIEMQHRHVRPIEQLLAGKLEQMVVDLDGHDRRRPIGHLRRERPGAGADFQHHILRPNVGRVHDQLLQVEIDQKVLPMPRGRRNPHLTESLNQEGS